MASSASFVPQIGAFVSVNLQDVTIFAAMAAFLGALASIFSGYQLLRVALYSRSRRLIGWAKAWNWSNLLVIVCGISMFFEWMLAGDISFMSLVMCLVAITGQGVAALVTLFQVREAPLEPPSATAESAGSTASD